jgi:hypothetical protein
VEIPGLFRSLDWLQGSGGCRYCHETDDGAGVDASNTAFYVAGASPLPAIRKPRLPVRWFPHSEFDHDAHRMMTCVECHSGNGVPDVYASQSTGDVLMPQLQLCRKCHVRAPSIGGNLESAGGACLGCHVYHQRQFEANHGRELEQLVRASQ